MNKALLFLLFLSVIVPSYPYQSTHPFKKDVLVVSDSNYYTYLDKKTGSILKKFNLNIAKSVFCGLIPIICCEIYFLTGMRTMDVASQQHYTALFSQQHGVYPMAVQNQINWFQTVKAQNAMNIARQRWAVILGTLAGMATIYYVYKAITAKQSNEVKKAQKLLSKQTKQQAI